MSSKHALLVWILVFLACTTQAQTPAKTTDKPPVLLDFMCNDTKGRPSPVNAIIAKPSPYNSKLVVFPYNKDAIYSINVFFNRYTHFEFEQGEKLIGLYVSDETEFERHVSVTGRDAMIRPRVRAVSGSATIITDRRRYQIELRDVSVCPQENQYQRVSWAVDSGIYEDGRELPVGKGAQQPSEEKRGDVQSEAALTPSFSINLNNLNTEYTVEGSDDIKPIMVMDDGVRTYLKFSEAVNVRPAMFAISQSGEPTVVEYAPTNSYLIAARIFEHGILLKLNKSEVRILSRRHKCGFWDFGCKRVNTSQVLGGEAR
jgi:type IV secretory pathway VirB9-like protein